MSVRNHPARLTGGCTCQPSRGEQADFGAKRLGRVTGHSVDTCHRIKHGTPNNEAWPRVKLYCFSRDRKHA